MKFGQETVAFRYYILFKKSFAWIILNKMPFYTIPLTQMQLVPFSHPQKSSNKKSKAAFLINWRSRTWTRPRGRIDLLENGCIARLLCFAFSFQAPVRNSIPVTQHVFMNWPAQCLVLQCERAKVDSYLLFTFCILSLKFKNYKTKRMKEIPFSQGYLEKALPVYFLSPWILPFSYSMS